MKAAVLHGVGALTIEERPEPEVVMPYDVKVQVQSIGLCGSDIHYYELGRIGNFVVNAPMVLGHETAGVIVEVGQSVSHLKVGDRVALEPGIPCGQCLWCKTGTYNLCPEVRFHATPPIDGTMQSFVVHPASYVFSAGDLPADVAALAEPLSVGVFAARECDIQLGQEVLVVGAGPIGLLTAIAAKGQGARVMVIDVDRRRLKVAEALGFEVATDKSVDVVLECSGSRDGVRLAMERVRPGKTICLIGMGEAGASLIDGLDIVIKGITIKGVFRYANTFPAALALLQREKEHLGPFLNAAISLEELPEYMQEKQYQSHLKTMVHID